MAQRRVAVGRHVWFVLAILSCVFWVTACGETVTDPPDGNPSKGDSPSAQNDPWAIRTTPTTDWWPTTTTATALSGTATALSGGGWRSSASSPDRRYIYVTDGAFVHRVESATGKHLSWTLRPTPTAPYADAIAQGVAVVPSTGEVYILARSDNSSRLFLYRSPLPSDVWQDPTLVYEGIFTPVLGFYHDATAGELRLVTFGPAGSSASIQLLAFRGGTWQVVTSQPLQYGVGGGGFAWDPHRARLVTGPSFVRNTLGTYAVVEWEPGSNRWRQVIVDSVGDASTAAPEHNPMWSEPLGCVVITLSSRGHLCWDGTGTGRRLWLPGRDVLPLPDEKGFFVDEADPGSAGVRRVLVTPLLMNSAVAAYADRYRADVFVDGIPAGRTGEATTSIDRCTDERAVLVPVPAGAHRITAVDKDGTRWDDTVIGFAGTCSRVRLRHPLGPIGGPGDPGGPASGTRDLRVVPARLSISVRAGASAEGYFEVTDGNGDAIFASSGKVTGSAIPQLPCQEPCVWIQAGRTEIVSSTKARVYYSATASPGSIGRSIETSVTLTYFPPLVSGGPSWRPAVVAVQATVGP